MAQDFDELFGAGADRPQPHLILPMLLLGVGLLTTLLGILCSSVPGVVLVLIAWSLVEREYERLGAGYFPEEVRFRLLASRRIAQSALVIALVALVVQLLLLCGGYLEPRWDEFFLGLRDRILA